MIKFVIGADASQFDKAVDKTMAKLDGLGSKLRAGVNTAGKWSVGTATAAAAMATAMAVAGSKAVNSQVELQKSLGGTYDALTAVKNAAKDSGLDGMEASLTRLNRRLGAAESGGGAAANAVKELGLDLREISRMDTDEKLAHISDRMVEMNISSEKAARLAQDLGFEQKQAASFFMAGGDSIRDYRKEIDELGTSISDFDAARVNNAMTAFGKLEQIMDGVAQQMAVHVAPIVEALSVMFVQAAKDAGGIGTAVEKGAGIAVNAIAFAADAIEGARRVGDVAFAVMKTGVLAVASVIAGTLIKAVEGFIGRLRSMIELANMIPKVNIDVSGLKNAEQGLNEFRTKLNEATVEAAESAAQKTHDALNKPLPGGQFKQFVADAKAASDEAAQAALDANEKMAAAFGGGEGGTEEDPAVEKHREQLAQRLEAIREANLEEMELLREKQESELEVLAEGREALIEQGIDFDALEADTVKRHQEEITAIESREAKKREGLAKQEAENKKRIMSGAMSALTTLMNSGSRKLFETGKVAAIAQSLIATWQGASEALKLGWPMGPIAAGAITTAGLANVQKIKSQSMGGGGGGGGGGSAATSAATAQINEASMPTQTIQRNINVSVIGDSFSNQQVRSLMGEIGSELGDNVKMSAT